MKKISKIVRWISGKRSYKWVLRDWIKLNDIELCGKVLSTNRFRQNLETLIVKAPGPNKKILIIAPHQDDETIGAGGTLILAAKKNAKIKCVYITDGVRATDGKNIQQMVKTREEEAKQVWENIGGETAFLRFPDGGTPLSLEAAKILSDQINNFNPDIIFLPFVLDDHPEHVRAVHLFMLSYDLIQNKSIEIWAYQVWSGLIPNVAVDISGVIDEKNKINTLWKSQNQLRDFVHFSQGLSIYNTKYIYPVTARYIEIFFVVPMKEYIELCHLYLDQNLETIYSDYENWKNRTSVGIVS